MDDAELKRLHVAIIAGDPVAQVEFEAAVRPYAFSIVRRRGLSIDDAQDLWNEAFQFGLEQAPTVTPVGRPLRAFILHVVHTKAVDLVRLRSRRGDVGLEAAEPALELAAARTRPLVTTISDVVATALNRCLEAASQIHRDVMTMMANGLPASEIAALLGLSEANAAKLRQRSRAWFKACLEGVIS